MLLAGTGVHCVLQGARSSRLVFIQRVLIGKWTSLSQGPYNDSETWGLQEARQLTSLKRTSLTSAAGLLQERHESWLATSGGLTLACTHMLSSREQDALTTTCVSSNVPNYNKSIPPIVCIFPQRPFAGTTRSLKKQKIIQHTSFTYTAVSKQRPCASL